MLSPTLCARCGHPPDVHGRRGFGSCSVRRGGPLTAAVDAVRVAVVFGSVAECHPKLLQ